MRLQFVRRWRVSEHLPLSPRPVLGERVRVRGFSSSPENLTIARAGCRAITAASRLFPWLLILACAFVITGCATQKSQLGTWEGPHTNPHMAVSDWSYEGKSGYQIDTPHYVIYTTIE